MFLSRFTSSMTMGLKSFVINSVDVVRREQKMKVLLETIK